MDAGQIGKIVMQWTSGMVMALGLKLTSSVDDIVWLAPFLTSNSSVATRLQNSAVYISICLVQTVVATCIAFLGTTAVDKMMAGKKNAWTAEKLLTVCAGCLLAVYSIKLLREYIQEMNEEEEDHNAESLRDNANTSDDASQLPGTDSRNTEAPLLENGEQTYQPLEQELEKADTNAAMAKEKERQQTLFCIAFIGSVDDLTLFVPMLVGKEFDIVQLCMGSCIAASAIVAFCVFIGIFKPIADFLSKIPLFVIVILFAVILLVKGFFFSG